MKLLRQVKGSIEFMEKQLEQRNKRKMKDQVDTYLEQVTVIHSFLELYISETSGLFEYWINIDSLVLNQENSKLSIVKRIINKWRRLIVDSYLIKLAKQKKEAKIYLDRLQTIRVKLNQVKYLL